MSSAVLPPILNGDLPLQNGQKAVNYIKENKLLNNSKFIKERRARSLARAALNSEAQQTSVNRNTIDVNRSIEQKQNNIKNSGKRKVKRNFRPRATSLFDFDGEEGTTNQELSIMQDTASSKMYSHNNTEQPSTAQQEEQQSQQ